jgi:hypothetical protein
MDISNDRQLRRALAAIDQLRGTRRWLCGMVAATALGASRGARAADDGPHRRPDYNSREAFRLECELLGGTFIADGSRIACHIDGVGTVDCDANGNDCWVTPESGPRPPGPWLPGDGNVVDGSPDEVAPGAVPNKSPHAQNQKPQAKRGKKRRGKRRHG